MNIYSYSNIIECDIKTIQLLIVPTIILLIKVHK